MATKTVTQLIDDVSGGEASETIDFGIDGITYEIDLNDDNAEALRETLTSWIRAGRRIAGTSRSNSLRPVSRAVRRGSSPTRDAELTKVDRTQLRAWAEQNGYQVAERGRIAAEVVEAWTAAGRP